ncbi:MAG: ExbD/TolR family protein, partial [Thermomonas haemolytica]
KEEKQQVPPVTITVTDAGELFLNDEPSTKAAIESRLSVEAQKTPQPPVQIRADKTTHYGLINDVVKIAQQQGIAKVGFVTTPPKKGQ